MSEREEKRLMRIGYGIGVAFIIASAIVLSPCVRAKNVPYGDSDAVVEEFTTEDAETDLRAVFDENSAMPCCDRESFERWYETYEPQTSEEARVEIDFVPDSSEDVPQEVSTVQSTEVETSAEVETETVGDVYTQYSVNGEVLNPDLQEYLYQRLAENSMEWFFPYSILICYQESRFNIYAENPNGLDKGLFQFRITYYPGQNIFDPYEQIDIFCQQMANRSQYDVYEMISRHNVSDFGSYNEVYVGQVLAHEQNLRKVN